MTPKVRQGIRRVWGFSRGKLAAQLTCDTVGLCRGFGFSAHWSRVTKNVVVKADIGPVDLWCRIGPLWGGGS